MPRSLRHAVAGLFLQAVAAGMFALLAPPQAWAQLQDYASGGPVENAATPRPKPAKAQGPVPAKRLFGAKKTGARLKPAAYGYYTRGCLAGAEQLEETGPAWQAMRLSRNRHWGHPKLVALVKRLAREARKHDGWPGLLVGDLSQPRGGPMLSGHRSHQMGLDADIWLKPMPERILTRDEREKISPKSMVLDVKRLNRKRWTEAHARLLYRAASYKEVERIFVHPPIKKEMCEWATRTGKKDRRWLGKIRAYYGHHSHFHIRIRCPGDVAGCRDQKRAPRSDDCKVNLAYWMGPVPWKPPSKKLKPRKPRIVTLGDLPSACRRVLYAN